MPLLNETLGTELQIIYGILASTKNKCRLKLIQETAFEIKVIKYFCFSNPNGIGSITENMVPQ